MVELNVNRQDAVHNACHNLIRELAGEEVKWDLENIGNLADEVEDIVCDRLGLMSHEEFNPIVDV